MVYSFIEQIWCLGHSSSTPPLVYNGQTATFADENIITIGGWLDRVPLAVNNKHMMDISEGMNWL